MVLFLLTIESGAQPLISLSDTLKINEVVVKGKPVLRASGFTKTIIDSSLIREKMNNSLADILRNGSPLFVKTYGPGGIASVSLRGAGASHTVVTWNGISLNSPMSGQTDFMLVPALLADEIIVYNGGSSVAVAQGGLGGVVDVTTGPEWNKPDRHEVLLSTGSYGRYSSAYVGRYGNGKWKFTSRVGYFLARNDFSYLNRFLTNEAVREKRENASFSQKIAVQEAWHKSSKSVTGIRLWLQETEREIPVPVNVSSSSHDEHLENLALLGSINHDIFFAKKIVWSSSASFMADRMHYNDLVTGIDSPISFMTATFRSILLLNQSERTAFKTAIMIETGSAESTNYNGGVSRNLVSGSLAIDHRLNSKSGFNMNSLINLVDGKLLPPDISAGFEIKPANTRDFTIKANMAAKSRVPTMNDLYWIPGGNTNLKPERGYSGEVTFDNAGVLFEHTKFTLYTTAYLNYIRDMIMWQPGAGGIWAPQNIGRVISYGIESGTSLSLEKGRDYLRLLMTYGNTTSVEVNRSEQLIYVPRNSYYGEIRGARGPFIAGTSTQYTGKRFIAADNSQYLPAYTITDLWAGIRIVNFRTPFEATVRFENLFNVSYQIVAFHPMPPASVMLNVSIKPFMRSPK